MAGGTPHDRTGRTLACPRRVLAAETASAVPADPGLALVLPCAAGMSASGDAVQTAVSTSPPSGMRMPSIRLMTARSTPRLVSTAFQRP